jgi:hypothetical protein
MDENIGSDEIRPRFRVKSDLELEELMLRIKEALNKEGAACTGQYAHGHFTLKILTKDRHYWSPQLSLTLEKSEDESLVRGLYGPKPAIWTMFMFFYSIVGLAILLVGLVGLSYLSLGKPALILWWLPFLIAVFLSLYWVAYSGKKIGKDQIIILHNFFHEATEIER